MFCVLVFRFGLLFVVSLTLLTVLNLILCVLE